MRQGIGMCTSAMLVFYSAVAFSNETDSLLNASEPIKLRIVLDGDIPSVPTVRLSKFLADRTGKHRVPHDTVEVDREFLGIKDVVVAVHLPAREKKQVDEPKSHPIKMRDFRPSAPLVINNELDEVFFDNLSSFELKKLIDSSGKEIKTRFDYVDGKSTQAFFATDLEMGANNLFFDTNPFSSVFIVLWPNGIAAFSDSEGLVELDGLSADEPLEIELFHRLGIGGRIKKYECAGSLYSTEDGRVIVREKHDKDNVSEIRIRPDQFMFQRMGHR